MNDTQPSSPMSKQVFINWLRRQVGKRTPAAVLRFADGELQLFEADPGNEESMQVAIGKLQKETGLRFSERDVLEVKALLELAYDEADVLGIHFDNPLEQAHRTRLDALAALYAERVSAGRRSVPLAHCMLSHQILDDLPAMLAGHSVSAISCRDLKPVLEAEWGAEDVIVYSVPSQYMVRDVDGDYEAALHDVPIWPDVHARICSELTVREPGEVFLVGAGIFGKDLCIRVRDRGGIALDMGSALDRIAGKMTRGPERRVLDLYASGVSEEDIVRYIQRVFAVRVGQRLVTQVVDAFLGDIAGWRRRSLRARYPHVYFDALRIEIAAGRATPGPFCGLAIGVVPSGGAELLGVWWQAEEAQLWPEALDDIHGRGVRDIQVAAAGDAPGVAEAVSVAFPQTAFVAATGPDRAISRQLRKAIESRGRFPDEEAATRLIRLIAIRASNAWRRLAY
jgi:Transposase, Mutator family